MGTWVFIRIYCINGICSKVPDFYFSTMAEKENRPSKKKQRKAFKTNEPLDLSSVTDLFICTKCTKSYRLRHSLTRHLKFECGKEPMYACSLCERKFKHKYDLNVHERGKHGIKIRNNAEDVFSKINNHIATGETFKLPSILSTKNWLKLKQFLCDCNYQYYF